MQVEQSRLVAVIILNRPERLNAISRETIRADMKAMDELENDETVAVVILRETGRASNYRTTGISTGKLIYELSPVSAE